MCVAARFASSRASRLPRSSRGSSFISPLARASASTTLAHRRAVPALRTPARPITVPLVTAPSSAPRPRLLPPACQTGSNHCRLHQITSRRPRNPCARTDDVPDDGHTSSTTPLLPRTNIARQTISPTIPTGRGGPRGSSSGNRARRRPDGPRRPPSIHRAWSSRGTIWRGGEAAAPGIGAMRFRGLRGCATWRWGGMQRDRDVPASEVVRQRIPDIARRQTGDATDTIPASLVPLHLRSWPRTNATNGLPRQPGHVDRYMRIRSNSSSDDRGSSRLRESMPDVHHRLVDGQCPGAVADAHIETRLLLVLDVDRVVGRLRGHLTDVLAVDFVEVNRQK